MCFFYKSMVWKIHKNIIINSNFKYKSELDEKTMFESVGLQVDLSRWLLR